MKNCATREFLEHIRAQEAYIKFHDRYFFVNGGQCDFDKTGHVIKARLSVYEIAKDDSEYIGTIYERESADDYSCVEDFIKYFKIDDKSFWDLETELEWI